MNIGLDLLFIRIYKLNLLYIEIELINDKTYHLIADNLIYNNIHKLGI